MMTDPVADMLTRIRNANTVHQKSTTMPASRIKVGIAQVLKEEGFISDYEVTPGSPSSKLEIHLKYGPDGELVLRHLDRVSKPGCRVYSGVQDLPKVLRGLGIYVLSTPKGIISDRVARKEKVGGEILCKVS
ncbi:MAG TPA: 30S ribosomal protein S8 [Planctomycetes bacterium]|nr:30S ribosomal protein S8 [Planctomycetota bacterium]